MNKKIIVLIACIITVIVVCNVIMSTNNKEEIIQENKNQIENDISKNIKIKNIISKAENSFKSVDIKYPEFQNLEEG